MPASSLPQCQISRITTVGCRAWIAARASRLPAASRVEYPSSFKTPAISIRMSASSSTIRMSCAMGSGTQLGRRNDGCGSLYNTGIADEHQRYPRPIRLPIGERQLTAVIFHDLSNDSETQAGALGSGRHVGFGQALTSLLRQALTAVFDGDGHVVSILRTRHPNLARCNGAAF